MASLKKAASWIGAGAGVAVPALTFFSSYAPPLFPASAILTAVADAIVLATTSRTSKSRFLRSGAGLVVTSVVLLGAYSLLRDYTTVRVPTTEDERLQIGFGTNEWTLTDAGRKWKRQQPSITAGQMIQYEGFVQARVQILWTPESVYAAATAMFLLYILTFVCWTMGFARLARQSQSDTRK